jgi:hypothetical protein
VVVNNPTPTVKHIRKGDTIAFISSRTAICEINNLESYDKFIKNETLETESINNIEVSPTNEYNKPWKPSGRIKFTNKSLTTE